MNSKTKIVNVFILLILITSCSSEIHLDDADVKKEEWGFCNEIGNVVYYENEKFSGTALSYWDDEMTLLSGKYQIENGVVMSNEKYSRDGWISRTYTVNKDECMTVTKYFNERGEKKKANKIRSLGQQ